MIDTAALLDAAKSRHAIPSDYRLAQIAGITKAAVSGYRNGKSHPDDATTQRLADLAGIDPDWAVACIQAERQRSDAARAVWRRIADRLAAGAGAAATAIVAAAVSGGPDAPARAKRGARREGAPTAAQLTRYTLRHLSTAAARILGPADPLGPAGFRFSPS